MAPRRTTGQRTSQTHQAADASGELDAGAWDEWPKRDTDNDIRKDSLSSYPGDSDTTAEAFNPKGKGKVGVRRRRKPTKQGRANSKQHVKCEAEGKAPLKVTSMAYLEGTGCTHGNACPHSHPKLRGRCFRCSSTGQRPRQCCRNSQQKTTCGMPRVNSRRYFGRSRAGSCDSAWSLCCADVARMYRR